jgi:phosphoribosylformimino-5-aminoimidazole carboxamide ribotide isomerase
LILIPAVDIRGGKAVRLTQGDYARETVYEDDPATAAQHWAAEGAERLHVVDLDGAREGRPVNLDQLRAIVERTGVPVQYGGGLRDMAAIGAALTAGADRVVLGTRALTDAEFLRDALQRNPGRVVVSVDARGGRIALRGWTETGDEPAADVVWRLAETGVEDVVYTSVDRDGMLSGPDPKEVRAIAEAAGSARLTYSGGIGSIEHLRTLACLASGNLVAVIAGKALYERRFTIPEAQRVLRQSSD